MRWMVIESAEREFSFLDFILSFLSWILSFERFFIPHNPSCLHTSSTEFRSEPSPACERILYNGVMTATVGKLQNGKKSDLTQVFWISIWYFKPLFKSAAQSHVRNANTEQIQHSILDLFHQDPSFQQENVCRIPTDWPAAMEYAQKVLLRSSYRISTKRYIGASRTYRWTPFLYPADCWVITHAQYACRLYSVADYGRVQAFDVDIPQIYGFWIPRYSRGCWNRAGSQMRLVVKLKPKRNLALRSKFRMVVGNLSKKVNVEYVLCLE